MTTTLPPGSAPDSAALVLTLVVALPGEATVDRELLDDAFREVSRIYIMKGLEAARAIGAYLLITFFDGDLARFRARNKKHATFSALGQISHKPYSASYLWYSVALQGQLQAFPPEVSNALPLSHHRELVHVRDAELRRTLAVEARGLSRLQLVERIRTAQPRVLKSKAPKDRKALSQGAAREELLLAFHDMVRLARAFERLSRVAKEDVPDEVIDGAENAILALEDLVDRLRDRKES